MWSDYYVPNSVGDSAFRRYGLEYSLFCIPLPKPIYHTIFFSKAALKGKNCPRLLELQTVAPNAKKCLKISENNRARPTIEQPNGQTNKWSNEETNDACCLCSAAILLSSYVSESPCFSMIHRVLFHFSSSSSCLVVLQKKTTHLSTCDSG